MTANCRLSSGASPGSRKFSDSDPNVYGFVGIDSEKYSGFAFGIGVERIAALKYNVPDLRMLMTGDMRFLRQF